MRTVKPCDVVKINRDLFNGGKCGIATRKVCDANAVWFVLFPDGTETPYGLTEFVVVAPAIGTVGAIETCLTEFESAGVDTGMPGPLSDLRSAIGV